MLQFPPRPLPANVDSSPRVLFKINGKNVFFDLPPEIPLALVLHFAPKLRQWIMPPRKLSETELRLSLLLPVEAINILADIDAIGLRWIINRMLQLGGRPLNKDAFLTQPNFLTSTSIYKAWIALELANSGIQALLAHIYSNLMLDDPVTLQDMRALWSAFPATSAIIHEMGLNFIRSHIDDAYTHEEFHSVRCWLLETQERWQFFKSLQSQFPELADAQTAPLESFAEKRREDRPKIDEGQGEPKQTLILEREKTKRVSPKEKRDRQLKDQREMQKRLKKEKSNGSTSSVETMIWNPRGQEAEGRLEETSRRGGKNHSQPVDSSALQKLLEVIAADKKQTRRSSAG